MEEERRVFIEVDADDLFSYALYQNGISLVRSVTIHNDTDEDVSDYDLEIVTDTGLTEPFKRRLDNVAASEVRFVKEPKLAVHGAALANQTEKQLVVLSVKLYRGETLVTSEDRNICVLPYNHWQISADYYPDIIAAFVQPNHPVVLDLLFRAAKHLDKITGSTAITGYQLKDPTAVIAQAAAAYAAIQELNLNYAGAPASFDGGQRIRMPNEIIEHHMGTCLDLTLLYAAVLEAMEINPILIRKKGHIFAGFWLSDQTFSDPICDDVSEIEKKTADGINDLIVVECTTVCNGDSLDFEAAVDRAKENLADHENFEMAIDVKRARIGNVQPISIAMSDVTRLESHHEDKDPDSISLTVPKNTAALDNKQNEKKEISKEDVWETKLLDLSLRNPLVSMRLSGTLPLLCDRLDQFEDMLSGGKQFVVEERPVEWDLHQINTANMESITDLGPYSQLIDADINKQIIHTWDRKTEKNKKLTKLYRTNKLAVEENGAGNLFVALGMLRWYETEHSSRARYAPIILYPVEINRLSNGEGYSLKKRDVDIQLNVTIFEYIKQNFQIQIPGLDTMPLDESGVDAAKIYALIRKAIMNKKGWDVVEACVLGNFSFAQFVMWNDIYSHTQELRSAKIVSNLIDESEAWKELNDSDVAQPLMPVPLDESQIQAVKYAEAGRDFVLHGPPGTGKSQTITAMIANALAKGKTILFVAEKKAALDVVYSRLKGLGIEAFCLELHSNKAVKKNILAQFEQALDLNLWGFSTEYEEKREELQRRADELNSYVSTLHRKNDIGLSVYELINSYEAIPDQGALIRYGSDYVKKLTGDRLDEQTTVIAKLRRAGEPIKEFKNNSLAFVKRDSYSQKFRMDLEDALGECIDALHDLEKSAYIVAGLETEPEQAKIADIQRIARFITEHEKPDECEAYAFDKIERDVKEISALHDKVAVSEKYLNGIWTNSIYQEDIGNWLSKYEAAAKKLLGKKKAINNVKAELQKFAVKDIPEDQIPRELGIVAKYHELQEHYKKVFDTVPPMEKVLLSEVNYSQVVFEERKEGIKQRLESEAKLARTIHKARDDGKYDELRTCAEEFLEKSVDTEARFDRVLGLLGVDGSPVKENTISAKVTFCDNLLSNMSHLRDWMTYCETRKECANLGLDKIIEIYENGERTVDLELLHKKSVFRAAIREAVAQSDALNNFTGFSFNELINEFSKINEQFFEITKDEIYYRLTHRLPLDNESLEIRNERSILRKAIKSGGRGMSLRSLFEQIPHIMLRLCPCLLMSPISVAQYLPFINNYVDIVIFDEASQLPTCKAVGAIARGSSAVVVGDPNQMPPTSFFATKAGEEENIELEDLDSILEDCLAIGMPSCYLTWHYRSRHESLIAFSNQEYYGNRMLTFPSVNDRERRVHLVTVDGRFSRVKGRINEKEGKAIVNELLRRYNLYGETDKSIGIITFNINQQEYIDDLLQTEFLKDPAFDKWANDRSEPLFVKNLENVQGDERDIILFSICFGQDDETGKLSLNFGPINQENGWKRLNVAVTRAREEMYVFSSMTADMIDLARTQSKGVKGVHDFLAYAQNGRLEIGFAEDKEERYGIIKEITAFLNGKGYTCQTDVGHSSFRVDIAVIDPENSNDYLLGILLDGEMYSHITNARDREVSQTSILKGLRWNLLRIWSIDWWDNKEKVLDDLINVIESIKENGKCESSFDEGPISEPITREKTEEKQNVSTKKEKKEEAKISSFDDYKRFAKYSNCNN